MKKTLTIIISVLILCCALTACGADDGSIKINEYNFPDGNFRNYLSYTPEGKDGVFTQEELANITIMNIGMRGIEDLTGIQYFTNLTQLDCYINGLTKLDLSQNPNITVLDCATNQISKLTLNQNTKLEKLICNNNKLTTLDLTNNTNLNVLDCNDNPLEKLYVDTIPQTLTTPDSKKISLEIIANNPNNNNKVNIDNNDNFDGVYAIDKYIGKTAQEIFDKFGYDYKIYPFNNRLFFMYDNCPYGFVYTMNLSALSSEMFYEKIISDQNKGIDGDMVILGLYAETEGTEIFRGIKIGDSADTIVQKTSLRYSDETKITGKTAVNGYTVDWFFIQPENKILSGLVYNR